MGNELFTVNVYYGEGDMEIRKCEKAELSLPFVPEEGEYLKLDGDAYEVLDRGFSVDSCEFSLLAQKRTKPLAIFRDELSDEP